MALIAVLVFGMAAAGPAKADHPATLEETLHLCTTCHGEKGASNDPMFPILAGQEFYYMYVQLKDFKSGLRESDVMSKVVADMKKSELKAVAQFFSEQQWPNIGFRPDPAQAIKGETATNAGQCVQCHRGGYEGDSRVPRLAGQLPEYLKKTMLDFKAKARMNSPAKSSLLHSYDDDDIAAMAEFLGGL